MKKLRLIVTSVIVLAIVGSAFSFKTKAGSFCVTANTSSNVCTTYKQNVKITTDVLATLYDYFPAWDGDKTICTAANNHLCTATFRLTGD